VKALKICGEKGSENGLGIRYFEGLERRFCEGRKMKGRD